MSKNLKEVNPKLKIRATKFLKKKLEDTKKKISLALNYLRKKLTLCKKFLINKLQYHFPRAKEKLDKKCAEIAIIFDKNFKLEKSQVGLKPIKYGLYISAAFCFIFFIWAAIAPINSASIAPGTVVLDFNKKTIQHFEGGIISEILVKEGDEIVTGTPLITLQNIQAKAQQSIVQKQFITAQAMEKRLNAETDYKNILDLSSLADQGKRLDYEEVKEIINTQYHIYNIRKSGYLGKIEILESRTKQLDEEVKALIFQKKANDKRLKILSEEIVMITRMVELKNASITEQLNVEKQVAELEGQSGSLAASIAKSKQAISETKLEILNFAKENLNKVLEELQEVKVNLANLSEQLTSTSDILKRTVIKAPSSGIVMNLQFHTKGAVIPPGGEIMNIIPQDEELIIEVRVNPRDIDIVRKGLKAKVNLSAFKAKKVPKLDGIVVGVSADIIIDEQTGEQYFLGRIKITDASLKKLHSEIKLYPGMPAEAFIITGSRSLLNYLTSPIKDATYKAFRDE